MTNMYGQLLCGKYRILRELGEGGMAQVFEGEHVKLGQRVAIKVLRDELCRDPAIVERFEREGRALSKLKSRHVVRVFDVDVAPSGAPFLVMERLEGRDLDSALREKTQLSVAEAVSYLRQACAAMAEAHRLGIVHRDLKPSNLFLATEGGQQIVKVLDFGIVKEAPGADVRLTSTQTTMGTPLYMAPEQFRSAKEVDARADVWALGATLYELLAGTPPFTGTATTIGISVITDPLPPIDAVRPDLPAALRAVIEKALEKEPERRFPSAMQLGEALAPWDDSGLVPASLANVVAGPGFASSGKHPARVALESAHTLPGVTVPDERSLAAGTAATQALPSTARTAEPASSAEPALAPAAPAPVPRSRAPWLLAVPLVVAAIGVGGYLAGRPDAAARATPLGARSAPPDLSTATVAPPPPPDPTAARSAPAPPSADPRAAPSPADPTAAFSAPVSASATTAPSLVASSSASRAPLPSARPVSVRSAATRPPAVPSPSASTAPLFFPR